MITKAFYEAIKDYKRDPSNENRRALLAELDGQPAEALLFAISQINQPRFSWLVFKRHRALFTEADIVAIARQNSITGYALLSDRTVRESLSARAWFEILSPHPRLVKLWFPKCKDVLAEAEASMPPYITKLACLHEALWDKYFDSEPLTDLELFLVAQTIKTQRQAEQLATILTQRKNYRALGVVAGRFNLNITYTKISGRRNQMLFIYNYLLHRPQDFQKFKKRSRFLNFTQLSEILHRAITQHRMKPGQLTRLINSLLNSINLRSIKQLNKLIRELPWLIDEIIPKRYSLRRLCQVNGINLVTLALTKEEYARYIIIHFKERLGDRINTIFIRFPNLVEEYKLNFFNNDHGIIINHSFLRYTSRMLQAKLAANQLDCLEELTQEEVDELVDLFATYPLDAKAFLESLRNTRLRERLTMEAITANSNLQYFIYHLFQRVGRHCEAFDSADMAFFKVLGSADSCTASMLYECLTSFYEPFDELDDPEVLAHFERLYDIDKARADWILLDTDRLEAIISRPKYRDILYDYDWVELSTNSAACYEVVYAHREELGLEDFMLTRPNDSTKAWAEKRNEFTATLTTNSGLNEQAFCQVDLHDLPGFSCLETGGVCLGLAILWSLHYTHGKPNTSFIANLHQQMKEGPSGRGCLDAAVQISALQKYLDLDEVKVFESSFSVSSWSSEDFSQDAIRIIYLPCHAIAAGRLTNPVTGQTCYAIFCANRGEFRYPLTNREAFLYRLTEIVLSHQEPDEEFELKLLASPSAAALNQLGATSSEATHHTEEAAPATPPVTAPTPPADMTTATLQVATVMLLIAQLPSQDPTSTCLTVACCADDKETGSRVIPSQTTDITVLTRGTLFSPASVDEHASAHKTAEQETGDPLVSVPACC